MIFSSLEEFIRSRVESVLKTLNPTSLPLQYLPDRLRSAATFGAMQSILFQHKYIPESQRDAIIATELKSLASVAEQNYKISKYAFVHSGSNVQVAEITSLLEAMCVEKPWETLYYIAKKLSLATVNPLKAEFENLSSNRHAAAHSQNFNIPNIDLKGSVESALAIGIALDVVLTSAVRNLNSCMAIYQKIQDTKGSAIEIYFISEVSVRKKFKLHKEGVKNPVDQHADLNQLKAVSLQKLVGKVGVVLVHDGSYKPREWYCEA